MRFIRVARLGGQVSEFAVPDGTPLLEYLHGQGISTEGVRVEFQNEVADEHTRVDEDGVVVLTTQVKGGV